MTSVSLLVWKIEPAAHELVAQLARVDQIAVVARRQSARARSRSGTAARSRACSRRRSSSGHGRSRDGRGSSSSVSSLKASATWPIAADDAHALAVGGDDAGALLSAVLQRVEAEVGEVGRFGMAEDAEDAALVFEFVHASGRWARSAVARSRASTPCARRSAAALRVALATFCCSLEVPLECRRPQLFGLCDRAIDATAPVDRDRESARRRSCR